MFSDRKHQKPHAKTANLKPKLRLMTPPTFDGKYCKKSYKALFTGK
jgi:hypothetical protein